jgi:DNA-binding PadR family transcriptional regulator
MKDVEIVPRLARKNTTRETQELLVLGLLAGGPKHGYEVRKEVEERISVLVGLKQSSVYYTLGKLRRQGFLESSSARSGKRPRKFVYTLTGRGLRKLRSMLLSNVMNPEKPFFNVDLSLYFSKHADMREFENALKKRLRVLQAIAKWDFETYARRHGLEIDKCIEMLREHEARMLKEEISFTRRLIKCAREEMGAK